MTDYQRLQLRASEIRSRLAELAKSDEPDNETRSEIETLRTEYVDERNPSIRSYDCR